MKQEIITIILAMTPTVEAHGAIALAIGAFKFSPLKAFLLSVLGTSLIIAPLLIFWHKLVDFFMTRSYHLNRFFTWLFRYTRERHTHHFRTFGESETIAPSRLAFWKAVGLYVFVAIPGPLTGIWAGTVAAFVFGIPIFYSVLALFLGALTVAGIDVLVLSGFFSLIR
ncbi:MAG TPA: small multi-drug export protein [Candidatus Paceibacterota bacterium]